jgi:NADH:ubiquinone oxidoreductase subunit 4 (subunit M)
MILSTCYALWLYNRLFSGFLLQIKKKHSFVNLGIHYKNLIFSRHLIVNFTDVNLREFLIFVPLIFFTIYFGLNPYLFINLCEYYFVMMFQLNFF